MIALDTNLLANGNHFMETSAILDPLLWGVARRFNFTTANTDSYQIVLEDSVGDRRPFTGGWRKSDSLAITGFPRLESAVVEPLVPSSTSGRSWDSAVNFHAYALSCVPLSGFVFPAPLSSECSFSGGVYPIWNSEALAVELRQPSQLVNINGTTTYIEPMKAFHFLYRVFI